MMHAHGLHGLRRPPGAGPLLLRLIRSGRDWHLELVEIGETIEPEDF
jgi:hypothetical protein